MMLSVRENMLKIAFVDNEKDQLNLLKEYCQRFEKESDCLMKYVFYENAFDLLEAYSGDFDAIFLDIDMPQMDGMTAATHLRKIDEKTILIFITNWTKYALEGYKVDAMDYILKPVSYFNFSLELKKIISRRRENEDYLWIRTRSCTKRLPAREIVYISIFNHDVSVRISEEEYTFRGTLKEIETKMNSKLFARCHNCYVVNLAHVTEIRDGFAILDDRFKVEISRSRKKEFLDALTSYINR